MQLIREDYLKLLRPYYDVDLIKVITGIRRSGKSVLMETVKDELLSKGVSGSHIISINLEDLDYSFITSIKDMHDEIKSRIVDDQKYYIFLDEIQHLEKFEKLLASLKAKFNCSIFVTGSDSTMLSGELATLLTGRTVEFEVFPFSFKESVDYLELNKIPCNPDDFIKDYIKWGGFPLRFSFREENSIKRFLDNLYSNIVNRDIVKKSISLLEGRHNIRGKGLIMLENFNDYMSQINSVLGYITVFVVFVAAISLLVGGIGVMNIMLVSVTERTREIGIRKALGARTSSIMTQFLSESAIISLTGGLIGIVLGILGAMLIGMIAGIMPRVNFTTVFGATFFSSAVGIFFGIYPAKKAAKLSPIEALRHE